MKRQLQVGVLLCGLLLARQVCGQEGATAQISPARRAKIARLIELTGVVPIALENMKAQMANVKKLLPLPVKAQDDFATEIVAAVTPEKFTELVVPVYDRHLSEEDLDGLIAYYQSPLGQKMAKLLPQITTECREAGEKWGGELGKDIGMKIVRKVQAGEYGPWPPPNGQSQEKPKP